MRLIWKILIVAVVIAVAVAGMLLIPRYRAKSALKAYREQLKRQGEKLTIAELTSPASEDGMNAGRALVAAVNALGYLNESPRAMYVLAPDHALVGWQEAISPTYDSSNCWPIVAEAIHRNRDGLGAVRAAIAQPVLAFPENYQLGFSTPLTYLPKLKWAGNWIAAAAGVALHERDMVSARNYLMAG